MDFCRQRFLGRTAPRNVCLPGRFAALTRVQAASGARCLLVVRSDCGSCHNDSTYRRSRPSLGKRHLRRSLRTADFPACGVDRRIETNHRCLFHTPMQLPRRHLLPPLHRSLSRYLRLLCMGKEQPSHLLSNPSAGSRPRVRLHRLGLDMSQDLRYTLKAMATKAVITFLLSTSIPSTSTKVCPYR